MPTNFEQPFRKLLERCSSSWLRLPAWVRGYGDEMLRFAERPTGRVCDSADPGDVALRIFAHPSEHEQITQAIAMLVKQGYLEKREDGLYIENFAKAQENYEAARKRAWRASQRPPVPNVPDADVPVPQEKIREDQRRLFPPLPPEGVETNDPKPSESRSPKPEAFPRDFEPDAEDAALASELALDCGAQVKACRDHHNGRGSRIVDPHATFRAWMRTGAQMRPSGTQRASPPAGEERRRERIKRFEDAKAGRYGPRIEERARTAEHSRELLSEMLDWLEVNPPPAVRLARGA